jgi:hypothetical protein
MISDLKWNHPTNWRSIAQYLHFNRQVDHRHIRLPQAAVLDWFRPWLIRADELIALCEQLANGSITQDSFVQSVRGITDDGDRPLFRAIADRTVSWFGVQQRFRLPENPLVRLLARLTIHNDSLANFLTLTQMAWNSIPENQRNVRDQPIASRLTNLLRELFTREIKTVPAEWKREEVVDLARTIDAGKQFHLMPILGDLLAEAGCTDQEMLDHARQPIEVHVKGCWLLDLLLSPSSK